MKDCIKSFAEYRVLAKEFKKSGSVCRKETIEGSVLQTAKELLHKLIALYAKYGQDYVDDNDFRECCGCFSLVKFDEDKVWLHYFNSWAYGGEHWEYVDYIEVPMKYLDSVEMEALEKELHIKRLIQKKKNAIEKMKKEVEKLEASLAHTDNKEGK